MCDCGGLCACGCLTESDRFLTSFQLSGTQTVLKLITYSAAHMTAEGENNILLSTHIPSVLYLPCMYDLRSGQDLYLCVCRKMYLNILGEKEDIYVYIYFSFAGVGHVELQVIMKKYGCVNMHIKY